MAWIILLRIILSVSANAVQKRLLLNRAGVYHTWILTYSLILFPAVVIAVAMGGAADREFWQAVTAGGALDAVGNLAMVAALRVTDISVFGPLNALRPIIALFFGWTFLHESPSPLGLVGVAITVAGGVILFAEPQAHSGARLAEVAHALFLRLSGLALGVGGAVFLKRAALHSSASMTVAAWIVSGLLVLLIGAAVHRPADLRTLSPAACEHFRWLVTHATVFYSMQLLTMRIFQQTLLAYSFVYFQLGMVLQVFIGRVFFQERAFLRRLIASAIMAVGSVLVLWKG